jgi:hypothetical protein
VSVIEVVTGVTPSVAPPSAGKVSMSGMKPDVRSTSGVGGGEYGTRGSTLDAGDELVGATVGVGSWMEDVAPVHATDRTSTKQGKRKRARRIRTRRV